MASRFISNSLTTLYHLGLYICYIKLKTKIMANITQKSDVTFDSQTINFTGVDLHILNAALHSYVYGGYKGDNMNHLDAAEKLYDEISNIYSTSVNSK